MRDTDNVRHRVRSTYGRPPRKSRAGFSGRIAPIWAANMMFFTRIDCQEERIWGGAACACGRCERSDWRSFFLLLPVADAAANDAVEKFYKGQTITSVVPFGPGGGYAIYNQIMARHLGKFIPGNPQIVPQYRPGAGGIVASNYVYNVAPRDGSVMAMVSDSVALASVIDADKTKYKVNEFIWLGAIERVNNVLAVRADTGVRTSRTCWRRRSSSAAPGRARRRRCCRRCCAGSSRSRSRPSRATTASIRCSSRSSATRSRARP